MPLPKTPALVTDCVVFDARNRVLPVRRKNPPFKGAHALPGGFVDIGGWVAESRPPRVRQGVFIPEVIPYLARVTNAELFSQHCLWRTT